MKQVKKYQEIEAFFSTYGFEVVEDCEHAADGSLRNVFQLSFPENEKSSIVLDECETDDVEVAFRQFYEVAENYVCENKLKPLPVIPEVDADSDEYVVYALSLFLGDDDTLETCPIHITSRERIENEEAQLIRFTFGEQEDSCVAVVWHDGTVFTPDDWQLPVWDNENWSIEDTDWVDWNWHPCLNLNGMPRRLIFLH